MEIQKIANALVQMNLVTEGILQVTATKFQGDCARAILGSVFKSLNSKIKVRY